MLLISALMFILWLRNFWQSDVVWAPLPGQGHVVIASLQGQVEFAVSLPTGTSPPATAVRMRPQNTPRWGAESYSVSWNSLGDVLLPMVKPLRYRRLWTGRELNLMAPYWCLIPFTWMLAAAPWVRWSKRFSLRAFFIATTLIAVGLGIYVTSNW